MGRENLGEVWDLSGDSRGGPGQVGVISGDLERVRGPSGRSRTDLGH